MENFLITDPPDWETSPSAQALDRILAAVASLGTEPARSAAGPGVIDLGTGSTGPGVGPHRQLKPLAHRLPPAT